MGKPFTKPRYALSGLPRGEVALKNRPVADGIRNALGHENVDKFHEIMEDPEIVAFDRLVIKGEIDEPNMKEWARVLPECLRARNYLAHVAKAMVDKLTEGKINADLFNQSVTRGGRVNKNGGIYWMFALMGNFLRSQRTGEDSTFRHMVLYKFGLRVFALMAYALTEKVDSLQSAHNAARAFRGTSEALFGSENAFGSLTDRAPSEVLTNVIAEVCKDFHFPHGTGVLVAISHAGVQVQRNVGKLTHMEQVIVAEEGRAKVAELKSRCDELLSDIIGAAAFRKIELFKTEIAKTDLYIYGDDMPAFKHAKTTVLCYARLHFEKEAEFVYPEQVSGNTAINVSYADNCVEIMVDRSNGELYVSPTLVPLHFFIDEKSYQYLRRHLLLSLKKYLEAKEDDIMPEGVSARAVQRRIARQRAATADAIATRRREDILASKELKAEERERRIRERAQASEAVGRAADVSTDQPIVGGAVPSVVDNVLEFDEMTLDERESVMPKRVNVSFASVGGFLDSQRFLSALKKLFGDAPRHGNGSHVVFNLSDYPSALRPLPDSRGIIVVPMHSGDLTKACVCQALRALNLTVEEFARYY